MKAMKTFPGWLIYIASVGLGFFAFVISGGILMRMAAGRFSGALVLAFIILLSLTAAYYSAGYSRRFMMRHVSRNAAPGDPHFVEGRTASQKRVALAMFLSGILLFPIFIFAVLSSIINAYV